jgi:hypothetical protein
MVSRAGKKPVYLFFLRPSMALQVCGGIGIIDIVAVVFADILFDGLSAAEGIVVVARSDDEVHSPGLNHVCYFALLRAILPIVTDHSKNNRISRYIDTDLCGCLR